MSRMFRNTLSSPYTPIELSQVLARFPSIVNTVSHQSRTKRYAHVTTGNVLVEMERNGFRVYGASEANVRAPHKRSYQRHMVRLRHESTLANNTHRAPEILLLNSHDGSSGFRIISGLLEFACLNGLVTGDRFESFSIRHTGDAASKVVDASFRVMSDLPRLTANIHAMQSRILSVNDQKEFAERALAARFGNEAPFSPLQINTPRRADDNNATLWSTFQRIQENITQGGASAFIRGSNGRTRRTTLRPIKAIDANVTINRELWNIADSYVDRSPRPMPALEYAA